MVEQEDKITSQPINMVSSSTAVLSRSAPVKKVGERKNESSQSEKLWDE